MPVEIIIVLVTAAVSIGALLTLVCHAQQQLRTAQRRYARLEEIHNEVCLSWHHRRAELEAAVEKLALELRAARDKLQHVGERLQTYVELNWAIQLRCEHRREECVLSADNDVLCRLPHHVLSRLELDDVEFKNDRTYRVCLMLPAVDEPTTTVSGEG